MTAPGHDIVNNDFPAGYAEAITPSDTVSFTRRTRGIYVGGDGNLVAIMAGDGAAITFYGVTAGSVLPIRATRINSTNTTATYLVALF